MYVFCFCFPLDLETFREESQISVLRLELRSANNTSERHCEQEEINVPSDVHQHSTFRLPFSNSVIDSFSVKHLVLRSLCVNGSCWQ